MEKPRKGMEHHGENHGNPWKTMVNNGFRCLDVGILLGQEGEVHHADIGRGHTEGHSRQLALRRGVLSPLYGLDGAPNSPSKSYF